VRLILTPTTIRMLAVRPDRQEGATARDPLARRRLARPALVIAVVLAVVIATLIAVAPAASPEAAAGTAAAASTRRPDIVLIPTDDMRFDMLWAMPTVQSELVDKGIEFTDAYVTNPLCCPSRAEFMTGQYSHTNGVWHNHPGEPYGGFPAFDDGSTIATWLHGAG